MDTKHNFFALTLGKDLSRDDISKAIIDDLKQPDREVLTNLVIDIGGALVIMGIFEIR